jgi:choloylglycine hydrolase
MCSRILWNNNKLAVVVARTMDWPQGTDPKIAVFPRGVMRDCGRVGPAVAAAEYLAKWTAKYGSMVTTVFDIGTADGFNERGLGSHLLYLKATDFGPRDTSRPGLPATLWAQFVLDNAATVAEALDGA